MSKLTITLGEEASNQTRKMAEYMEVNPPETVRRGLTILNLLLSLKEDEELVIRDKKTKGLERIRFQWSL